MPSAWLLTEDAVKTKEGLSKCSGEAARGCHSLRWRQLARASRRLSSPPGHSKLLPLRTLASLQWNFALNDHSLLPPFFSKRKLFLVLQTCLWFPSLLVPNCNFSAICHFVLKADEVNFIAWPSWYLPGVSSIKSLLFSPTFLDSGLWQVWGIKLHLPDGGASI